MLTDVAKISFNGRINRLGYLGHWVGALLVSLGGGFVSGMFSVFPVIGDLVGAVVVMIAVIAAVWIAISGAVKRFHDLGQSGWMSLLGLVPFIGVLVWLYLLLMPGNEYNNEY